VTYPFKWTHNKTFLAKLPGNESQSGVVSLEWDCRSNEAGFILDYRMFQETLAIIYTWLAIALPCLGKCTAHYRRA